MTNDNTRTKANAVFFSVLMVLSMVAVGFAAPAVATAGNSTDDIRPETSNPTKQVDDGATVFQGETIEFNGSLSGSSSLIGVAGAAEGQVLEPDVQVDQTPGRYTTDGNSGSAGVTVTAARITTAEIRLDQTSTEDVDGSSVSTADADNLEVFAEFNFEQAEDVAITVEDPSGTDITNAVLNGTDDTIVTSGERGGVVIDLSDEDAGEYTVIYEGSDDLDIGSVIEERTITIDTDETVEIETSEESVTRGTNVEYTVSGGTSGDFHMVSIDREDFRDSFNASTDPTVFRNTGDTDQVGFTNGSSFSTSASTFASGSSDDISQAVALIEMDGSQGVGTIRTNELDDSSIDIDVYDADVALGDTDGNSSVDDTSFEVTEGELTLDSPSGTYVIGSETDLNGTASGADNIDVYVRDQGDWQLHVAGVEVDADDTFEVEDIVLTDSTTFGSGATSILSQAGNYRIGIADSSEFNGAASVSTTEFTQATSISQSIQTVDGDLTAELQVINGQINNDVDDATDITGSAEGQQEIILAYVDRRGNVKAERIDVEDDGTLDIEDRSIPAPAGSATEFAEGVVTAHFISPGRDNNFGDGELPNGQSGLTGLQNFIDVNVSSGNLNAEQVRERIVAETTDETASDDLMVTQSFRYAESQTTIDSVYPDEAQAAGVNPVAVGETMVVAGSTNLRPDDNSVTVELFNQDDESIQISSTDTWENDGQWSASLDTSDLEPGTYVVESDDSTNTDRAEVEIVEERDTAEEEEEETTEEETTEEETTEEETTEEETEEETTEEETTEEETTEEETEEEATDDSTPGFGALVALVALVAAALLATRRRDE